MEQVVTNSKVIIKLTKVENKRQNFAIKPSYSYHITEYIL